MPQPKKAPRFGNTASHHNMMMANLTTELIRHGRIRTTKAKAKSVQPLAEKMITFAKRGDVHARRQVLRVIRDKDVVHKLFADVGPAFAERDGGYTRVLKLGPRKGDAAEMALIELVEGISVDGVGDLEEAPRRRWSLRRRQGTQSTAARERSEERAAAVDRGEDPELVGLDEDDAVATETVEEEPEGSDVETAEADGTEGSAEATEATEATEGVGADPAEVEARLAAQEAADAEAADAEAAEAEADGADADPAGAEVDESDVEADDTDGDESRA